MPEFSKRKASTLLLKPATFADHIEKGMVHFVDRESAVVGAQCQNCHNVVWFNYAENPVLNQRLPENMPATGERAQQYMQEKWEVVLSCLPNCPECKHAKFDRHVTDYSFQRWPTGDDFILTDITTKQTNLDASEIDVWLLGDDPQDSIFDKAWIHHVDE